MIDRLRAKVAEGGVLLRHEASLLSLVEGNDLFKLFHAASEIRHKAKKGCVSLCAIVNAKSGACSEDCLYCSQSARSKADVPVYPLMNEEAVMEKARGAQEAGVKRFCIVTSGRKVSKNEIAQIALLVSKIRGIGLLPCATLGLLDREDLRILRESGLERYHHNLETSESYFPRICSTHTFQDKLRTIEAVKSVGLSLCSGGIFGLGESWEDRIDMAMNLRDIGVDSVPLNFLIPVPGTAMEGTAPLHPFEALKIVSLYRFIFPAQEVRVCGGRRQALGEFNSMVFLAGADSILTGNYLTTTGTPYEDDLKLIRDYGLTVN